MNYCNFEAKGETLKVCRKCGQCLRSPYPPEKCWAVCTGKSNGAGSHLKRFFEAAYLKSDGMCGCDELAAKMNRRGPEWCEKNIELILDKLRENAAKRGLPYTDWLARGLVRDAIKKSLR